MSRKAKLLVLAALTVAAIAAAMLMPRIAQDPLYHSFADQRILWGIANFMNVASNLPFVIVGIYGMIMLKKYDAGKLLPVYAALFIGIILTGLGSAYYHYTPDNDTLVWDRLPMTIVFMSLLSAIIAQRIDERAGLRLLIPLLLAGIASVWWWHHTEQAGAGDLRAYGLVQFYPMLFIPLVIVLFRPPPHDRWLRPLVWVVIAYAIAKACERFDHEIFSAAGISGHSLKHLAAAAATFFIVRMYIKHYPVLHHVQRS